MRAVGRELVEREKESMKKNLELKSTSWVDG